MRLPVIIATLALLLAACQSGGRDPYLTENLKDYFYGKVNPIDEDPDFTYGRDIDGS
jgi:hypothetical protein